MSNSMSRLDIHHHLLASLAIARMLEGIGPSSLPALHALLSGLIRMHGVSPQPLRLRVPDDADEILRASRAHAALAISGLVAADGDEYSPEMASVCAELDAAYKACEREIEQWNAGENGIQAMDRTPANDDAHPYQHSGGA